MRAALFPGQGIDANAVADAVPARHALVERASELLGYDLKARVDQLARQAPPRLPLDVAQPAIFVAGLVSHDAAVAASGPFDFFTGHSLGEYTALVAAGSIPFSHGVKLVAARGAAMRRAARRSPGRMVAIIGLDLGQAEEIARSTNVVVANDNSPVQVVLAGEESALSAAAGAARSRGARAVLLSIDAACHSHAMGSAEEDLREALDRTDVRGPRAAVISNVTAAPYRAPGEIRKLLVRQLTHRVRFRECIGYLADRGVRDFVDLGPGAVVGPLARTTLETLEVRAGV